MQPLQALGPVKVNAIRWCIFRERSLHHVCHIQQPNGEHAPLLDLSNYLLDVSQLLVQLHCVLVALHVVWDSANREYHGIQVNPQLLKNATHFLVQSYHLSWFPSRHVIGSHHQSDRYIFTMCMSNISNDANIWSVAAPEKLKTPTCQCDWIRVNTRIRLSPMIKWTAPSGILGCA